ncbi:PilZ domain-containing protein [Devosia rhodophyticola]|uniref:PilZ domain-containing protein n=1 Tax=Devosia rhodophyticola TaxID=3026423 RepID=A0ABY7YX66_9HYPH|nr:PilZ domain-containing protein [Devosia rhodophyticola]WDR05683.1 PilZ domain-containing protein [Devosia rhodophyticola]
MSALAKNETPSNPSSQSLDVRYIGAIAGCFSFSDRELIEGEPRPVYACRLCSITPKNAVIIASVAGAPGENVAAHFEPFGVLRATVGRRVPTGFSLELLLGAAEQEKLAARIEWQKRRVQSTVPDLREFKRILPRNPRAVMVLKDGTKMDCFVVDISSSGAAISAETRLPRGTPVALGQLIGRVVRQLEVGFAVQFTRTYEPEQLETLMATPMKTK